jgi:hypothetical protein
VCYVTMYDVRERERRPRWRGMRIYSAEPGMNKANGVMTKNRVCSLELRMCGDTKVATMMKQV